MTNDKDIAENLPDLERQVFAAVRAGHERVGVNEVVTRLTAQDRRLAYTTVMTVLTRLWKKGLVGRVAQGRAYAYRAAFTESELATQKMTQTLAAVSDRASVLAGFVGSLSKRDVGQLRRLLGESGGPRR